MSAPCTDSEQSGYLDWHVSHPSRPASPSMPFQRTSSLLQCLSKIGLHPYAGCPSESADSQLASHEQVLEQTHRGTP